MPAPASPACRSPPAGAEGGAASRGDGPTRLAARSVDRDRPRGGRRRGPPPRRPRRRSRPRARGRPPPGRRRPRERAGDGGALDRRAAAARLAEVDRQLTGVLVPVQVFAAATYPIVLHHPPGQCGPPPAVLAEMPPGGVLLQVIEYPPRAPDGRPLRVPRLPRRPHRFAWSDATWAPFECAGPSFQFTYRQAGHALQAQVWMNRATVVPGLRRGALRILDHLRAP